MVPLKLEENQQRTLTGNYENKNHQFGQGIPFDLIRYEMPILML